MPIIRRARQPGEIQVPVGANLMKALQDAGIPVASSCAGEAVCGKCRLNVTAGAENLSPVTRDEEFRCEQMEIREQRLSCQAEVLGDVTVDARYW